MVVALSFDDDCNGYPQPRYLPEGSACSPLTPTRPTTNESGLSSRPTADQCRGTQTRIAVGDFVVLVNTTKGSGSAAALLQVGFAVSPQGGARIESYPEGDTLGAPDDEEASIALLYRHKRTYAIGHGCAADWDEPVCGATPVVRADPLPAYEVTSLTPDVYEEPPRQAPVQRSASVWKNCLRVPRYGARPGREGSLSLQKVDRRSPGVSIPDLPDRYRDAADTTYG